MIKNSILIISFLFILTGCNNSGYEPDNLNKISKNELQELFVNGNFYLNDSVKYKNKNGKIIPLDSVKKIPDLKDKWFLDFYKNDQNEIKEIVIRKVTEEDLKWKNKLRDTLKKEKNFKTSIIDVECSRLAEILEKVHFDDQSMRKNGNINFQIDQQNLNIVASIIEKCGMPTLNDVNEKQLSAIWLVIQHADKSIRKKYFPILKTAAENGDLSKRDIAMMEDRMMMDTDKPQIYGTQVFKESSSGLWKLYKIKNPERVNIRRSEVGFEPLDEYLEKFGIEFKVKQKQ